MSAVRDSHRYLLVVFSGPQARSAKTLSGSPERTRTVLPSYALNEVYLFGASSFIVPEAPYSGSSGSLFYTVYSQFVIAGG